MILEEMYILIHKIITIIINLIITIQINQNLINNSKRISQKIISINTIIKLYSIILLMHLLLMISNPIMIKIIHTHNINHSNSVDILKLNHSKKFKYDQLNYLILIILSHYVFITHSNKYINDILYSFFSLLIFILLLFLLCLFLLKNNLLE
jgi:hypothetical protein